MKKIIFISLILFFSSMQMLHAKDAIYPDSLFGKNAVDDYEELRFLNQWMIRKSAAYFERIPPLWLTRNDYLTSACIFIAHYNDSKYNLLKDLGGKAHNTQQSNFDAIPCMAKALVCKAQNDTRYRLDGVKGKHILSFLVDRYAESGDISHISNIITYTYTSQPVTFIFHESMMQKHKTKLLKGIELSIYKEHFYPVQLTHLLQITDSEMLAILKNADSIPVPVEIFRIIAGDQTLIQELKDELEKDGPFDTVRFNSAFRYALRPELICAIAPYLEEERTVSPNDKITYMDYGKSGELITTRSAVLKAIASAHKECGYYFPVDKKEEYSLLELDTARQFLAQHYNVKFKNTPFVPYKKLVEDYVKGMTKFYRDLLEKEKNEPAGYQKRYYQQLLEIKFPTDTEIIMIDGNKADTHWNVPKNFNHLPKPQKPMPRR